MRMSGCRGARASRRRRAPPARGRSTAGARRRRSARRACRKVVGLHDLEALVHQRGGVDRDLAAHRPRRVRERLVDGDVGPARRAPRPRNGPPDAVMTMRSTAPTGPPASSWCTPCARSRPAAAGRPVASASCVTSSPPTTSDSLFASARSMPSPSAATVGPSPAEPTSAFRRGRRRTRARAARAPRRRRGPRRRSTPRRRGRRRRSSASAMRSTPWRAPAATSVSGRSALRPTSSRSSARWTMSRACVPIDPVDPRMRRRRGKAPQDRTVRPVPYPRPRRVRSRRLRSRLVGRPPGSGAACAARRRSWAWRSRSATLSGVSS